MSMHFNVKKQDRATFEGKEVLRWDIIYAKGSKEVEQYCLTVHDDDHGAQLRRFRPEEISHLIDSELLIIDRGYHSIPRQVDRQLYGTKELFGATKKQRHRVDRIMFLARRMEHFHRVNGMVLTPAGVDAYRSGLDKEYQAYQARVNFGTDKPNASQQRFALPTNTTLLEYFRKFRRSAGNPSAFLVVRGHEIDTNDQKAHDFALVMGLLQAFASNTKPSKGEVIDDMLDEIRKINQQRTENGFPVLIKERSVRTYERWIDLFLDPFEVVMQREGEAAARAKFGVNEGGMLAGFPGKNVQFDAWRFHIATRPVSRAKWQSMTPEERKSLKLCRRWVVVAIDVATRCILGFAICSAPNELASLEALRMCYRDKTPLFRDVGIEKSSWNFVARLHQTSTDSGSEFGKHPFGGAAFSEACRRLTGTLMNTVAGVPELRGHIERFFRTCEQKWARYMPGWTASNPQARNDRKPGEEGCLTDDDLQDAFINFIAQYHATPHRGLNFKTPATAWQEMKTRPEFDPDIPGPKALRDACGFYAEVSISSDGIRYAGNAYSNAMIRNERSKPVVDRIARPGEKVEIKVDPLDLGSISVLSKGDLISVPCLNRDMVGKSLRQWHHECRLRDAEAKLDMALRDGERREAKANLRALASTASATSEIGMGGYTPDEIRRAKAETNFGKGRHEKPFVGVDEYEDPLDGGYETAAPEGVDDDPFDEDDKLNEPTSADRYRSAKKTRRNSNQHWEDQE